MDNTLYLLSFTASGIKNIEKPVKLEFYKKTVDHSFDPSLFRIKSIYGENGSGKTALITAVKILKDILFDSRYLGESTNQKFLAEIVNKRNRELHLECEFLDHMDSGIEIFRYIIELASNRMGEFEITHELLQHRSGEYSSSKFKTAYECLNGELVGGWKYNDISEILERLSTNRLSNSTFSSICIENMNVIPVEKDKTGLLLNIFELFILDSRLVVSIEKYDQHTEYLLNKMIQDSSLADVSREKLNSLVSRVFFSESAGRVKVGKEDFGQYNDDIKRLERFLKLFKYDLVSVDVDAVENKDYYECTLLLNYGDYRVNVEFESTGINKLIRLFSSMDAAAAGYTAFIDEMDSNINDIYLCKLVEFFMKYGQGQLCFTTHNTSPMPILRKNKNSIDFLTSDNRIVPWRTNGHFAPDSLYKSGMIPYLPFNIEAEDFLGILGDEIMGIQLLFCIETNKAANTDWIYINKTIRQYYKLSPEISLKTIPMGGKTNYRNKTVNSKIKSFTNGYSRNGKTIVFFCIDTDNCENDPDRKREFDAIYDYCCRQGYEFIWFCRDIEEVYWGERIESGDKVKMAGRFNSHDQIQSITETDLSSELVRKGKSNILVILDRYLERV